MDNFGQNIRHPSKDEIFKKNLLMPLPLFGRMERADKGALGKIKKQYFAGVKKNLRKKRRKE